MDSKELRLELLKIVYRKDQHPEAAVAAAVVLEEYINQPSGKPEKSKGTPGKGPS